MVKYTLAIDTDHQLVAKSDEMTAYITGKSESTRCKYMFMALEELTAEEWDEMHETIRTEWYGDGNEEWSHVLATPGYFCHERNGVFKAGEHQAALTHLNNLNIYDWQRYVLSMKYRLRNLAEGNPIGLTPEDPIDLEFEIARAELVIKQLAENQKLRCNFAYMTLGLYLTHIPSPGILAVIKSRAEKFAAMKGFSVLGYRLITERVTLTSEPI